jgi:cyclophilin family peptidyl-prolyl cis-trans isomerase
MVLSMSEKQYSNPPDMTIDLANTYTAKLNTNRGTITLALNAERSPLTVNNFVFLARDGYYDGCIFHRVISGFMVQGGDPTGTGRGGPGYRFRDELEGPGKYTRGTLAMANAGPNTNGSQFFIMHQDGGLPHSYSIFGQVTDGIDVVDTIAAVDTDRSDKPTDPIIIDRVEIEEIPAARP